MNGDSRETGKQTPDGKPDPSVFSTERNREGIRVGTAISTLVRREGSHERDIEVRFRSFWGTNKRAALLASLADSKSDEQYEALAPHASTRFVLRPIVRRVDYSQWPSLESLLRSPPFPGLLEKRGGGLIDIDRKHLKTRMREYLDAGLTFEQARHANPALATDRARYDARTSRHRLMQHEGFKIKNAQRYCLYGFDMRWAYVTGIRPVWNECRPQLIHLLPDAKGFLIVRQQRIAEPEGFPAYWATCLADDYVLHKHAFLVPIIDNLSGAPRPNLSEAAAEYLTSIELPLSAEAAEMVLHHALAMLYSPLYLGENEGGLRQGWPRLPLPKNADLLQASADLGAQVAEFLNPDVDVPGVSNGSPRSELASIAVPSTEPGLQRDWHLSGWGNRTNAGVTMPLRGRVSTREYTSAEAPTKELAEILGDKVLDIGISPSSFWRGVPEAVWECRIGGYQVLKKWLSYRDHSIIDGPLTSEEVGHFQQTARRIAAILLLGPALDASYQDCLAAHG